MFAYYISAVADNPPLWNAMMTCCPRDLCPPLSRDVRIWGLETATKIPCISLSPDDFGFFFFNLNFLFFPLVDEQFLMSKNLVRVVGLSKKNERLFQERIVTPLRPCLVIPVIGHWVCNKVLNTHRYLSSQVSILDYSGVTTDGGEGGLYPRKKFKFYSVAVFQIHR